MQDSVFWMLDSGRWNLDVRLWMLDSKPWQLDSGPLALDSWLGRWTLKPGPWTLKLWNWKLSKALEKWSYISKFIFNFTFTKIFSHIRYENFSTVYSFQGTLSNHLKISKTGLFQMIWRGKIDLKWTNMIFCSW